MWAKGIALASIKPAHVGTYSAEHPGSGPTKKLHLSANRSLFDLMVVRHAVLLNPAVSVRGEKCQVIESKTPEISIEQARKAREQNQDVKTLEAILKNKAKGAIVFM